MLRIWYDSHSYNILQNDEKTKYTMLFYMEKTKKIYDDYYSMYNVSIIRECKQCGLVLPSTNMCVSK